MERCFSENTGRALTAKIHNLHVLPFAEFPVIDPDMLAKSLLNPILADDSLTRGLGDAEARVLVEWLVERMENCAEEHGSEERTREEITRWCRRARAISRFVTLWCHQNDHGAACQLAATERFPWPFPATDTDPCDLMIDILGWEKEQF